MFKLKQLSKFARSHSLAYRHFTNANSLASSGMHLIYSNDPDVLKLAESSLTVKEDFLSESEENSLLLEIEPIMKKKRYEFDHWDNVIGFF